jgi:hypothetical protein
MGIKGPAHGISGPIPAEAEVTIDAHETTMEPGNP